MSQTLEYLICTVGDPVKGLFSKEQAPQLFEWYAAIFPGYLTYKHVLIDPEDLPRIKAMGEQARPILGAWRRKKDSFKRMTPTELQDRLLERYDGGDWQEEIVSRLIEVCEDRNSPWSLLAETADLTRIVDDAFLAGFESALRHDFNEPHFEENLRAARFSLKRLLDSTPYGSAKELALVNGDIIALLLSCAILGPAAHQVFLAARSNNGATWRTDFGRESELASIPCLHSVEFRRADAGAFRVLDSVAELEEGVPVELVRTPGFRRLSDGSCELGVGDGTEAFSRRSASVALHNGCVELTCHSGLGCLVIHWAGGRTLVGSGESIELENHDIVALAPQRIGAEPVPRIGRSAIMLEI